MSYISASAARFWLRVVCSHCRFGMDHLLGLCFDVVPEDRDRCMGDSYDAFYGLWKVFAQIMSLQVR